MSNKVCQIENCASKHKARGLCMSHYMTELRHENGTYQHRREPRMFTCSVRNCKVKLSTPALCGTHYAKLHSKAKPVKKQQVSKPKQQATPCVDCGRPSFSNNMCQQHYNDFKLSASYVDDFWSFVKQELQLK